MKREKTFIGKVLYKDSDTPKNVFVVELHEDNLRSGDYYIDISIEKNEEVVLSLSTTLKESMNSFNSLLNLLSGIDENLYNKLGINISILVDNIIVACIKRSLDGFAAPAPINIFKDRNNSKLIYNGVSTTGSSTIVSGDIIGGDDNDD